MTQTLKTYFEVRCNGSYITVFNIYFSVESEPHSPKEYYNFKNVSSKRKWLADVLQENTDSTPEDAQYKHIIRMHSYQKNLRKTKEVVILFIIITITLLTCRRYRISVIICSTVQD